MLFYFDTGLPTVSWGWVGGENKSRQLSSCYCRVLATILVLSATGIERPGQQGGSCKRAKLTGKFSGSLSKIKDGQANTIFLTLNIIRTECIGFDDILYNILQWLLLEVFSLEFGILCKVADDPFCRLFFKMTCFMRGDAPLNPNSFWLWTVYTRTFVFTLLVLPLTFKRSKRNIHMVYNFIQDRLIISGSCS